ncbi:hypothetical protein H6P81_007681 [Aristolochia fimbriata]|uniref:Uncharacterized protein n=1 Tax=Aristolochia fimbriata TaxID=158543 RepID=A0AAV7F128_ARIFI|nr:hypothetical protein H6P81_007681 [Aristolochia fimbriata]
MIMMPSRLKNLMLKIKRPSAHCFLHGHRVQIHWPSLLKCLIYLRAINRPSKFGVINAAAVGGASLPVEHH